MSNTIDSVLELVRDEPIDIDALELAFEEIAHDERVDAIRHFGSDIQRRLFDCAEGRSMTIDDVVPPDVPATTEVIHEGQNTLPVFSAFQKRFCRPDSEAIEDRSRDVLWGYNEQALRLVTGPGYFVAYDDESTGEVCIDYREIPAGRPEGWPEIILNERRLGRFVYAGTVDRLRRVSEHVSIGRAYVDDDEAMDNWFVLVRTPR
jgi:hypothetical protein